MSVSTSLYLPDVHIHCVPGVVGPPALATDYYSFLELFLSSAILNLYTGFFFFVVSFSLCIKSLQPLHPPVTVFCSRASPITMTVTMAPISVGLAALGKHNMVLTPQLIRGTPLCHSNNNLSHRFLLRYMALMPLVLLRWVSLSELNLPLTHYILHWCLLWYMLLGSCVAAMLTNGSLTIGVCSAATLWGMPLDSICASWRRSVAHVRSTQSGCSFYCFD